MRHLIRSRAVAALAVVAAVPALTAPGSSTISGERCEANRAAGTITYLTGFDYAAAASMVDVFVAHDRGYYDDLCLDVEVVSSFSTTNYPLIASGEAQFASAGSFSEVLNFAAANDADLVALLVEGRFPIDALIAKPGIAETLEDFEGTTIGVKGAITSAVAAMLAGAGLIEGEDYETVPIDGFDPLAHIALDGIAAFPGYKSNEPGQLDRAGIDYDLFDPVDHDVPGSFGVVYTSREFIDEHPTAAQDFVRATLRGLADALDDPAAAVEAAFDLAEAGGNPMFLSPESEAYRWETDAALIADSYGNDLAYGVPDVAMLQAEVDAYAGVGIFTAELPAVEDAVEVDLVAELYGRDGEVIWPG
jgi:ABC-type nitrate/sulfonate/bicarbonate transport system substrate-binding protein